MVRKMHVFVHGSKHRVTQTIFFIYNYMTEYKQAGFSLVSPQA